ncbi:MAG: DUF1080 domain-containing protein [Planctomycetia bacterium]|nr:DUF1080 domain-containing protein [Planctomycetia bacterium]
MPLWCLPARAGDNELTAQEKHDGYVLLFDGRSLDGFRSHPKRGYHKWFVQDGVITLTPATPEKDPNFEPYPLWTVDEFDNYVLKVDFHTGPDPENGHSALVLRLAGKPDIRPQPALEVCLYGPARKRGYFCTGAFRYSIQPPAKTAMKPAGEWNSLVVTVDKRQVVVVLNEVEVNRLDLNEWTTPNKRPDGSAHLLPLALKDLPTKSPLGFRDDYGIPIWLKNLKVKPIK